MTKKAKEPHVNKVDQRMRELTQKIKQKPAPSQWDMCIQQAIYELLVGNRGYRKIGQRHVINTNWIEMNTVSRIQNVGASGIRSYRTTLKNELKVEYSIVLSERDKVKAQIGLLSWWQFKERKAMQQKMRDLDQQATTIQAIVMIVENLKPPIDLSKDTIEEAKNLSPDQELDALKQVVKGTPA